MNPHCAPHVPICPTINLLSLFTNACTHWEEMGYTAMSAAVAKSRWQVWIWHFISCQALSCCHCLIPKINGKQYALLSCTPLSTANKQLSDWCVVMYLLLILYQYAQYILHLMRTTEGRPNSQIMSEEPLHVEWQRQPILTQSTNEITWRICVVAQVMSCDVALGWAVLSDGRPMPADSSPEVYQWLLPCPCRGHLI